jgi:hypothetical protein
VPPRRGPIATVMSFLPRSGASAAGILGLSVAALLALLVLSPVLDGADWRETWVVEERVRIKLERSGQRTDTRPPAPSAAPIVLSSAGGTGPIATAPGARARRAGGPTGSSSRGGRATGSRRRAASRRERPDAVATAPPAPAAPPTPSAPPAAAEAPPTTAAETPATAPEARERDDAGPVGRDRDEMRERESAAGGPLRRRRRDATPVDVERTARSDATPIPVSSGPGASPGHARRDPPGLARRDDARPPGHAKSNGRGRKRD